MNDELVKFLLERPGNKIKCSPELACELLEKNVGNITVKMIRPDVYEISKSSNTSTYVYLIISVLVLISLILTYF